MSKFITGLLCVILIEKATESLFNIAYGSYKCVKTVKDLHSHAEDDSYTIINGEVVKKKNPIGFTDWA